MTTKNPDATLDPESLTVTRTIAIAASQDAVWRAVTEPELISRWFGLTELDGSGEGARGTMTFEGYGAVPLAAVALDPPHAVTYRWNNDDAGGAPPEEYDDEHATEFTFTLRSVDGGTELTVVERLFEVTSDPAANLGFHRLGWTSELDKLVVFAESEGVAIAEGAA
ncbi:SRPBCC domain-containing protein [Herbiconiux moechotypicola]|uniref:Activator of Hsp90 ATPase homologue 1/2-like C-terminal domain-containing protein n=1 Tax=Herbiconiux moechotypicola TaxID=637393 RepID=A0ABN3E795_9MICO|nr:SRPBCC domain-containing protein [Herbiconiux moechotypicola]MCS5732060.1 SRPBCC domain-containing protein [Herbiconiux moechotypicola]